MQGAEQVESDPDASLWTAPQNNALFVSEGINKRKSCARRILPYLAAPLRGSDAECKLAFSAKAERHDDFWFPLVPMPSDTCLPVRVNLHQANGSESPCQGMFLFRMST